MKEEKKVSVIVPVYNAEKYLEKCVNSIVNQTYKNLEIILINDGSKDNSLALCKKFNADARVVVIDQENRGAAGARNSGISIATGDYISFVDADDWVENTFIEKLVNLIQSTDSDISICKIVRTKNPNKKVHTKKIQNYIFDKTQALKEMLTANKFHGGVVVKLFKREIIKEIKFDTSIYYGEDLFYSFNCFNLCKKISYTNEKLYYNFLCPSTVRSKFIPKKLTLVDCMERIIKICETLEPEVVKYAKGWTSLICLELLYYIIRDKYKNKEVKDNLKKKMKEYLPSLKSAKEFKLAYRIFVPIAYHIIKFI